MHELGPDEHLLGWLYVGGLPEAKRSPRTARPLAPNFSSLD